MRKRTKAREIALQILYQIDITEDSYQDVQKVFWDSNQEISHEHEKEIRKFSERLVKETLKNLESIDEIIENSAEKWRLSRMAVIERNILRFATYELLFCAEIPPIVSINEAIDLAKKYSGLEAGKFVNGILDKIKATSCKPQANKPQVSGSKLQVKNKKPCSL